MPITEGSTPEEEKYEKIAIITISLVVIGMLYFAFKKLR